MGHLTPHTPGCAIQSSRLADPWPATTISSYENETSSSRDVIASAWSYSSKYAMFGWDVCFFLRGDRGREGLEERGCEGRLGEREGRETAVWM